MYWNICRWASGDLVQILWFKVLLPLQLYQILEFVVTSYLREYLWVGMYRSLCCMQAVLVEKTQRKMEVDLC